MPDPLQPHVPASAVLVATGSCPVAARSGAGAAALLLLLGGCALVDQRSFDRSVNRAPVPHAPPASPGPATPAALAVIRFGADPEGWKPALDDLVRQALARKPQALFRVQTVVPATGTAEAQAARLSVAAGTEGTAVAERIAAAGASTAQIEMTAMSDASVTRPEVRLYVR